MKKSIGIILCLLMILSVMAGCSAGATVVNVDGTPVTNGIYLYYQMQACSDAQSLVEDTTASLYSQQIEGVDAKEWILNRTVELCQSYVFVERTCEQKGLALTEEQKTKVEGDVDTTWEKYSASYEKNGISKQSILSVMINDEKAGILYDELYSDFSGEVSEQEVKEYLDGKCVSIKYVIIPKVDAENAALSDQKIESATAFADELFANLKAGGEFETLVTGIKAMYEDGGFTGENLKETDAEYVTAQMLDKTAASDFINQILGVNIYDYEMYADDYKIIVYQRTTNYENQSDLDFYKTMLPQIKKESEYKDKLLTEAVKLKVDIDKTMAAKYSPENIVSLTVNT